MRGETSSYYNRSSCSFFIYKFYIYQLKDLGNLGIQLVVVINWSGSNPTLPLRSITFEFLNKNYTVGKYNDGLKQSGYMIKYSCS